MMLQNRTGAVVAALLVSAAGAGATAQAAPEQGRFAEDAFLDSAARELFSKASAVWGAAGQDLEAYTARIDQRIAAALRTPLKDRVIYHGEVAVRAFWERDRLPIVQLLGSRARYPGRSLFMREAMLGWIEEIPFDGPVVPGSDRLFIGTGEGAGYFIPASDDYLAHPLGKGADTLYRFRSRDTTTITFPDGRQQAAVRLDVIPRVSDPHLISGTLWIDPVSGALVRGAYRVARRLDMAREFPEEIGRTLEYRLVPGLLKPLTVDIQLVVVDYSLWEFEVWMPRMVRYEGQVAAGVVKIPMSIDYLYRIESVTRSEDVAAADVAERPVGESREGALPQPDAEQIARLARLLSDEGEVRYRPISDDELDPEPGRAVAWIAPVDPGVLEDSPHLPPPIWEDAPGLLSESDVEAYFELLAGIPEAPVRAFVADLSIGWERPDLLRYNRVEGPAVGGRFEWTLHGAYRLGATGFFGFADRSPKVRLDVERMTVLRRVGLGVYHELRATETGSGYLGPGNSLDAFLFGRDNGEYFGATGADFTWRRPANARQSFLVRAYAERQEPVTANTGFALIRAFDEEWDFRPNLAADEVDEAGGEVRLTPRWGKDSERAEFGADVFGRTAMWRHAGNEGKEVREGYAQASATVTAIVPLWASGWQRARLGLEAAGGHTWGQAPIQRSWFLGGPGTLRGYPASEMSGLSYFRGRAELSGTFEWLGASVFMDAGWAGPAGDFESGDILRGAGVGLSLLDGVMRLDLSRGLSGPARGIRIEAYFDAIL
ncbi:MAG: hypothetical protein F4Z50_01770 [Gemmatimonadetes bacterium]|nr:hypothetical protein [Gemmatimonadota bacterium]